MAKFPISEIDIMGVKYDIFEFPKATMNKIGNRTSDEEQVLGYWMQEQQTIALVNTLRKDVLMQTLLHEILHAIDSGMGSTMSEQQTDYLASSLYCVIKNNPALFQFIWKKEV